MTNMDSVRLVPLISLGSFLYVVGGMVFMTLVPNAYEKVPPILSMCGVGSMMIVGNAMTGCALASFIMLFLKRGREAPTQTKLLLVLAALLPAAMFLFASVMFFREFTHGSIGH